MNSLKRKTALLLAMFLLLTGVFVDSFPVFAAESTNAFSETSVVNEEKQDLQAEETRAENQNQAEKLDQPKKEPATLEEMPEVGAKKEQSEEKVAEIKVEPGKENELKKEPVPVSEEAVVEPAESFSIVNAIYLDGVNGDDNKDGLSKENAVKSFAKAKELAKTFQSISTISVVGAVDVEGKLSLEGTNAKIIRGEGFAGYLFRIARGKEASLSSITIDGGGKAPTNKKSMIYVEGTLNIGEGALLENNQIVNSTSNYTMGGAIYATKSGNGVGAVIRMNGGTIRNNQANYGGGIYAAYSTIEMTGGVIEGNQAVRMHDGYDYHAGGGGILIADGSTLNFSEKALVQNNTSDEVGGGISVGRRDWSSGSDTLNMTGGVIKGNRSGSTGGGIFVQAAYQGAGKTRSMANVSAGQIIENQMTGKGFTEKMFGGGAIYVNGYQEGYDYKNGELHLTNAIIKDNEASSMGGGYASCPVSETHIYVKDGAAIYNNKARNAKELYILASMYLGAHSGDPSYEVSERMLGGKPYKWQDNKGTDFPLDKLKGVLKSAKNESLQLQAGQKENADIESLGKVLISGNTSATNGGGIGSNGTVYIGTDEPKKDIEIEKTWGKGLTKEAIEVEVYVKNAGGEYLLEKVTLNEENQFKAKLTNLPEKVNGVPIEDLVYVKELVSDKYTATISPIKKGRSENANALFSISIHNEKNNPKISFEGMKVWEDGQNQDGKRPDEVVIKLLKNGKETDLTTKATKENGWQYRFENLDTYDENGSEIVYGVKEEAVEGYTSRVEDKNIINTHVPEVTKVEVTKRWVDDEDKTKLRPLSIKVSLLADGQVVREEELTSENSWMKVFENLPVYKAGKKIDYTIKEETVENYQTAYAGTAKDGFTITNTIEGKISIPVTKKWVGKAGEKAVISLLADGKEVARQSLSEDNHWQYVFEDLPQYEEGKEILYTVKEEKMDGYEDVISGDIKDGFLITNTNISTREISVSKKWKGSETKEIIVELLRDGKKEKTAKIRKEDGWKYTFKNLAVYDKKDGHEYLYTVEEAKIEGYESSISGDMDKGYTITNKEIEKPKKPKDPPKEKPSKPKKHKSQKTTKVSKSAKTKDLSGIEFYQGLLLLSMVSVVVFLKRKKRA
ncbi:MAG TPA: Cna B-type domain-containing protein [Lachnospiraceae bacterium]